MQPYSIKYRPYFSSIPVHKNTSISVPAFNAPVLLDFCAKIFLGKCAKALARPPSLSALLPSPENEKVKSLCLPRLFCLNPKWVSNPTVEKDPIQWMRFNESKNPFYLNHLNKITHPLKFIKK